MFLNDFLHVAGDEDLIDNYKSLHKQMLVYKDIVSSRGRPKKEFVILREQATSAWNDLGKMNLDTSNVEEPFWKMVSIITLYFNIVT